MCYFFGCSCHMIPYFFGRSCHMMNRLFYHIQYSIWFILAVSKSLFSNLITMHFFSHIYYREGWMHGISYRPPLTIRKKMNYTILWLPQLQMNKFNITLDMRYCLFCHGWTCKNYGMCLMRMNSQTPTFHLGYKNETWIHYRQCLFFNNFPITLECIFKIKNTINTSFNEYESIHTF